MIDQINYYSENYIPFLFIIDFEKKNPIILPISEIDNNLIRYNIEGLTNFEIDNQFNKKVEFQKKPIEFDKYNKALKYVQQNQYDGNSYLVNLTFPTAIQTNLSLEEIYLKSRSEYKLYLKDKLVVFSPETFVRIKNNKIYSCPMKGTIDAGIENAHQIILNDEKEFAEHLTIVDLIRNDLSIVAKNVKVDRFRYLTEVETNQKKLLQVSSEISGDLPENYRGMLGNILEALLPAGSISGAPKCNTVEIIKNVESCPRGYYTGIFGYYDGYELNSAVMIRFIEKEGDNLFYRSGGGITIYSDPLTEYTELIDKVYVPIY